jgi:hypothetical protein
MENKFARKMDWGTPRLVTKNRMLKIEDPKTIASRKFLLQMANSRKGNNIAELPMKKTAGFANSSISNFRKKMLEEELASEDKMEKKDLTVKENQDK